MLTALKPKLNTQNAIYSMDNILSKRKKERPYTQLNFLWRWGSVVMAGLFVNFLLDLIFGLIYKNYILFQNPLRYLQAIVISFIIIAGLRGINHQLDSKNSWGKNPIRRFFLQTFTNIAFVLFIMVGVRFIIMNLLNIWQGGAFFRALDEVITIFVVVVISFIIVLIDLGFHLLSSWRNSLAEIERFTKERVEFEFEMLRNQINPHFLFNSLNTASGLIFENQEAASKFVKQMAKVYRYVLEHQGKDVISLKEEKQFIVSFIYLLELRFTQNLYINYSISERYDAHLILPMSLQLLLENALKHNIVSRSKPLTIDIYVEEEAGYLVVNNNLQKKNVEEFSSNIGLKNITNRYKLLSDKPVVIIESENNFTVKIPLIERNYASVIN